jgi:glycerol-3-phosphate acyltransferase PlsX
VKAVINALLGAFDTDDASRAAAQALVPALLPLYETFNPDTYGGAMLLGVNGVCVISHGSSRATAIRNAIRVAAEMVRADVVSHVGAAVKSAD